MKTLTINMKANDTAEILLYAVIGSSFFEEGITAKEFREQIKGIKAQTLNLRINSPGGNVFEASAMMAALDDFKGSGKRMVEVDIDGLAASAASVVAMAGNIVRVASNGLLMIHNPMSGLMGGADDMRREADLLDKVKGQIIDAYRRKSKEDRAKIAAWMDAETWFTGQEAVEAGLADAVTAPVQIAALVDSGKLLAKFKYHHPPVLPEKDMVAEEETRKRKSLLASLDLKLPERRTEAKVSEIVARAVGEVPATVPVVSAVTVPAPAAASPSSLDSGTGPRTIRTVHRDEQGRIIKVIEEQVPARRARTVTQTIEES